MPADLKLRDIVQSTWFQFVRGVATMVILPAVFAVGGMLSAVLNEQQEVRTALVVRAADNEVFQAQTFGDLGDLQEEVAKLKDGQTKQAAILGDMREDIAMMRGILEEFQRRDVAFKQE